MPCALSRFRHARSGLSRMAAPVAVWKMCTIVSRRRCTGSRCRGSSSTRRHSFKNDQEAISVSKLGSDSRGQNTWWPSRLSQPKGTITSTTSDRRLSGPSEPLREKRSRLDSKAYLAFRRSVLQRDNGGANPAIVMRGFIYDERASNNPPTCARQPLMPPAPGLRLCSEPALNRKQLLRDCQHSRSLRPSLSAFPDRLL
jgi:hypothetical protein